MEKYILFGIISIGLLVLLLLLMAGYESLIKTIIGTTLGVTVTITLIDFIYGRKK